ncbi:YceI family protein [Mucilaginibacter psychrotolerans]|uniref:YceI family protein n=1 Tax=Mucilaginibacter psychrotolerans TaxID=1524096 RepID=A0A4Y8S3L7_9SPHI|nr:YceI family protein [Mucilaginibacter psychrotolerans]TFF33542.1 YceI family protein [Mucilaginibacter psychrotolerans]
MKTKLILLSLLCLSQTILLAQKKVAIDTKTSLLKWTGHAEIGTYAPSGTLNLWEGVVYLKGDEITAALLTVDMKSMKQENSDLVNHLKSEDFFDVEKYSVSTIKINSIRNGKAYGQITMKNKTQAFECPIAITKTGGELSVTGKAIIDRTKYGIIYNSGSFFSGLGDHAIKNTFDVAFNIVVNL